jgi:starch phosphorylase
LKERIIAKVLNITGKPMEEATDRDLYYALAAMVNDEIIPNWHATKQKYEQKNNKQVYYLSMEFLVGSLLENYLLNTGMLEAAKKALHELGFKVETVFAQEHDAGLGNGGLGRLAACFLDSLASLKFAGHGCGIRYRYGLFEQRIIHGNQI